MGRLDVERHVSTDDIEMIEALLDAAAAVDGRRPLSDHLALDLENGGGDGFAALIQWGSGVDHPVAYAQVSRGNDTHAVEVVVHPDHRDELDTIGPALLRSALDVVAADGGGLVNWWVFEPTDAHRALAASVGMRVGRTLYQMRRSLPTGLDIAIETRAFVPGADEAAWVEVNNRAFAGHGEQGGWTVETMRRRQREPWFDPDGLRILDRDGRIAGFCWTKVHPSPSPDQPADGEIYVIAVDPDFHGSGLGKQLTLAGLDHLHQRGITSAMLYVDAANAPAVALYDKLGFTVAATTVAFEKLAERAAR